jgi:hypothetical protein
MQYRKKPVVIEAMRFTNGNAEEVASWCGGKWEEEDGIAFAKGETQLLWLKIPTLEGVMIAGTGDWVIRGVKGEFYPCKPDIFDATYEAVT